MKSWNCSSIEELPQIAKELLEFVPQARLFAFYGEMGAGKTTFIKSICKVLGSKDEVSSPTFALVNEYVSDSVNTIYHFDFYRINSVEEAYDMGFEEYIQSGFYCFVEWPEMVSEFIDDQFVSVRIRATENERTIEVLK